MKSFRFGHLKPVFVSIACCLLASATAAPAMAQEAAGTPLGVPQDWSHRHVIHSNPDTMEEAAARGTLDNWITKADDPRFVLQLEKKVAKLQAAAEQDAEVEDAGLATSGRGARKSALAATPADSNAKKKPAPPSNVPMHRDWSNVMGGAGGAGDTRTYPAKYAFRTTTKDCVTDFIVFTTSTAGASSSGNVNSRTGTFSGVPAAGGTVTITNAPYAPDQVLTLTAHASTNTGLNFAVGANANEAATNLANAIARNGGAVGATAAAAGAVVTLNSITTAVTNANFTAAESLSNFGPWGTPTAGTGAAGQPTIFALNQLYADTVANGGCQTATQAVPDVYWSYNTGAGAVADLSPVLSFYDGGKQVAFMQRVGTVSSLVLLKWSSTSPGTLGVPTAPASVTAANYRTCTAPCMLVMPLAGNHDNTNSSPYVDYTGDAIYVGDDTGKLHRFTGAFRGTPAEAGAPWPVQVAGATSVMSSPVFDGSNTVFIGSNGPGPAENRLYRINVATGAVTISGAIGSGSQQNGIRDAPILDTGSGKVYVFQGDFASAGTDSLGNGCGGNCQAVFAFATNFAAGSTGSSVFVGASGANNNLQRAMSSGAFDDDYYSSGGVAGNLYVCGSLEGTARRLTLWKIGIAGGVFVSRTEGPNISDGNTTDGCSPVAVFVNGSTERLYASVTANGAAPGGGGCTTPNAGCVYMYNVAPSFGTVFDSTTASSTTNAAARFFSVSSSLALNATETAVDTALAAATAGTYQGMTISQGAATVAATTNTFTLRVDRGSGPVSTTITCSIPAGGTTCTDATHQVGFSTGDLIDVQVTRTGSNMTTTFRVQLTADVSWNDATTASAAINAAGGTGGIIIDNTVTGGGSQVYYSTRSAAGTPGIAVQASQAGLN